MSALMGRTGRHRARGVLLTTSGCMGFCAQEPVMTVEVLNAEPVLYGKLDADKARLICREHVLKAMF